jgi:hypothetical protein
MTHDESERYQQELCTIMAKLESSPRAAPDMNEAKSSLRKLAARVGASEYTIGQGRDSEANVSELTYNIHQALQTACMLDMCRTATSGHEMAKTVMDRAQKIQWVAMAVSLLSMVAAWVAAVAH